jgi:predicted  nucleic acid-binding Zn-ribbon protein
VIDAEGALDDLDTKIAEANKSAETAQADEARDRENLTALKGNDAAKRFVDELNHAEDTLQGTRKQIADLQTQKQLAEENLNALVSGVSFNWDVETK